MLDDALAAKTTDAWLEIFAGTVPSSPIHDIGQAMNNPFVAERGGIQEFPNPAAPGEMFRMAAHPIRSADDAPLNQPAPALGADTDEVLGEIGFDTARLAALRGKGVI